MKRAKRISSTGLVLWGALMALGGLPARGLEPLASAETNWDGVSIDIMSVARKGSVLTVKWAVRNEGESAATVKFVTVGGEIRTYVVDEENGTKYYVLTDQEGHSLASQHTVVAYGIPDSYGIEQAVAPGAAKRLWAKFPAPPPEVQTISIYFDETEPFEDLPITDR